MLTWGIIRSKENMIRMRNEDLVTVDVAVSTVVSPILVWVSTSRRHKYVMKRDRWTWNPTRYIRERRTNKSDPMNTIAIRSWTSISAVQTIVSTDVKFVREPQSSPPMGSSSASCVMRVILRSMILRWGGPPHDVPWDLVPNGAFWMIGSCCSFSETITAEFV